MSKLLKNFHNFLNPGMFACLVGMSCRQYCRRYICGFVGGFVGGYVSGYVGGYVSGFVGRTCHVL